MISIQDQTHRVDDHVFAPQLLKAGESFQAIIHLPYRVDFREFLIQQSAGRNTVCDARGSGIGARLITVKPRI